MHKYFPCVIGFQLIQVVITFSVKEQKQEYYYEKQNFAVIKNAFFVKTLAEIVYVKQDQKNNYKEKDLIFIFVQKVAQEPHSLPPVFIFYISL